MGRIGREKNPLSDIHNTLYVGRFGDSLEDIVQVLTPSVQSDGVVDTSPRSSMVYSSTLA